MATVFMRWLETRPESYERGLRILTLNRIHSFRTRIAEEYVDSDTRVLEIGCGTGVLSELMAGRGGNITGIDISSAMLSEAKARIGETALAERTRFILMDAMRIGDLADEEGFDLIVCALMFSELNDIQQRRVLAMCAQLLSPDGKLLILDEVIPAQTVKKSIYFLVRLPLQFLTWLLTRTSTTPLRSFETVLVESGYRAREAHSALGGTLLLYEARSYESSTPAVTSLETEPVRLRHRLSLRWLMIELWSLFFRIVPPYPKFVPGLYTVGEPDSQSPVLLSGNFELSVGRLVKAIDGRIDAWLLVADSGGINVWCAAGGGYFTAENVIAAIRSSGLKPVVEHGALILPQLCANGVDGERIHQETGWRVHWGPVRAEEIPSYLSAKRTKSESMRLATFPVKDRLEMVTVTLGFYGLLILLPFLLFWPHLFLPVAVSLAGLSYFYGIVHPWLPGRDGLLKSIPLTMIALAGLLLYASVWGPLPVRSLFNWVLGLIALSVFTAAEMQGMSPLMRGEQANWKWEAVIGAGLGIVTLVAPKLFGWS